MNQYESEVIGANFALFGFEEVSFEEFCDVYVINTCTVTAESDRKSRQFIRRAVKRNPNAVIIVTGCFAQTSPEVVAAIDGVDFVCGNDHKTDIPNMAIEIINSKRIKSERTASISVNDIGIAKFENMQLSTSHRTRAYVKIEDGCESKCAYCIIPKARGKVRSKALVDVLDEVNKIVTRGCSEIVLTGIETASYGLDFPYDENHHRTDLADLLFEVNKIEGIKRIRLGSLDPSVMTRHFVGRISTLEKLMPQFHLSMQCGCDKILNLMRRKYNTAQAEENISTLREMIPNVTFTTDIMTGFPEETEANFQETLDFCQKIKFLGIHIFTYSKRKGTLASAMANQVEESVKQRRSGELSELQKKIKKSILEDYIKNNAITEVLVETCENNTVTGHSPHFIEITATFQNRTATDLTATFQKIKLTKTNGEICFGEII